VLTVPILLPASQRTAELPSLVSALGFWANGREDITPYWRVIKPNGCLNEKVPGCVEAQAAALREEGDIMERAKGKRLPRVKGLKECLQMPAVMRPTSLNRKLDNQ
jgi:hypothetical protein